MKKNIIKILTIILMLFMLANITGFVYADEINPGDFSVYIPKLVYQT